jgi:two-component system, LytTR family, sensor kinase
MFSKSNQKILMFAIHMFLWTVMIIVPLFLFQSPERKINWPKQILSWVSLILIFYFNYVLLIPKLLNTGKFLIYGLAIILLIFLPFVASYLIQSKASLIIDLKASNFPVPKEGWDSLASSMMRGRGAVAMIASFLILAISTSIKVTEQWYTNEKERKEVQTQKLSAELSLLKQQINPHFFFNTLNSIYSLASRKSEKTPEAIIKLSELMRYIIYESDKEFVPLRKELEYISNYVQLQRLRIKEEVEVQYTTEGDFNDIMIEPMILLPFIENAFKHGIDYSQKCNININVTVSTSNLLLVVENPSIKKQKLITDESSGKGLTNSRKRLELLYPSQHELVISDGNDRFRIELRLNLRSHELYNS